MMKRIGPLNLTIRHEPWTFRHLRLRKNLLGQCLDRMRTIEMSTAIKDPTEFQDTFNHEVLHALFPKADEETITRAATDLTYAQLAVGIRFTPQE